jgi:hypothetical protein
MRIPITKNKLIELVYIIPHQITGGGYLYFLGSDFAIEMGTGTLERET